jgi:thymidylate kinase
LFPAEIAYERRRSPTRLRTSTVKKFVRIIPSKQHHLTAGNQKIVEPKSPTLELAPNRRKHHPQLPQYENLLSVDKIALHARVLIIEGISGSGKDTLQAYFQKKLAHRDVHDYSEGEVLHSWKQLQIDGIAEIRINFMIRFVNYIRDVIRQDENAVFLLNRFHLSTYASTIVEHPDLETQYDQIIAVLQTLPVHVFILQLDENQIEQRSLHPERSSIWRKFQRQIAKKNGFRERLAKQQELILEVAGKQQISYSLINLYSHLEGISELTQFTDSLRLSRTTLQVKIRDAVIARKKGRVSPTL